MNSIVTNVLNEFKKRFATTPKTYYSPGRINLIGEHIDYNSGFVMPAAINKGIYYAVAPNNSDTVNIYALDFKETYSVTLNAIAKNEGWKNYLLSVLNEFILLNKPVGGFDCVFGGDIPVGSGMSSSAAVEGGLAFAINDIFNLGINRKELALLCQRAEHNYPNVKCGIMDMYASLNGKKDHVLLLDCETIEHEYFPFAFTEYSIVLINSKVHHSLASGEYNLRRMNCESALKVLKRETGIQTFRDVKDITVIEKHKDELTGEEFNCAIYVVQEIERTQKAGALLRLHDLEGFGKLMYQTHEGLSGLYKVSCPELDFLVNEAKKHPEIIGARLMGGGFGGCTINIVKKGAVATVISAIKEAYLHRFSISAEVYLVEISSGTDSIFSN